MKGLFIVICVLVIVLTFLASYIYKQLLKRRAQVDESWGQIDAELKTSHELIYDFIEALKKSSSLEKKSLFLAMHVQRRADLARELIEEKGGQVSRAEYKKGKFLMGC